MEKSYCQFPSSGDSWIAFPEPDEDEESEGIEDAFPVLEFS